MTSKIDRLLKDTSVRTRTADQMRQALCHFYLGQGPKKDCLDAVNGCSETTYYRIKNEYPDLVEAIDHSARREALLRTSGQDIAFQARQKRKSHKLQERAAEALLDPRVMDTIVDIALGKPRTVAVGGEDQHIIVYPRDQIRAFALLQKLAREGVLPETEIGIDDIIWIDPPADDTKKDNLDWMIGAGVPTDFKTMTATTADGREVKGTVA
ncbi:MAG: hypothetical protein ACOC8C_02270 [Chloroflexota bacterium]